jgi:toxin ParE1/3/4
MIIKWLEDAVQDLRALQQHIALDRPIAASNVARRIIDAVSLLSEQPGIGRHGRIHGTRELIISGTPYVIPYRVKNNAIEILRVFHGAIKWPERLL